MKLLFTAALLACLLAIGTQLLPAQEPVLPTAPGDDRQPVVLPTPAPQLIPDDVLPATPPASSTPRPAIATLPELDASLLPPPLTPAADGYRRLIEWRKLRNAAQNDPEAKAALAKAETARTDLQKRKLLDHYYDLLYAKMTARAPAEMKPYLQDRKREAQASLPQPHVRPTPTPAATPKSARSSSSNVTPAAVGAPPAEPPLPVSSPSATPILAAPSPAR